MSDFPEHIDAQLAIQEDQQAKAVALSELRQQVMEAKGPSRELDARLLCALAAPEGSKVEQSPINGEWCIYEPRPYGRKPFGLWVKRDWYRSDNWPLTSSFDACLALVERKLPGWACGVDIGPITIIAFVDPHDHGDRFTGARYTAAGATAPLAILAALLTALEKEERDG